MTAQISREILERKPLADIVLAANSVLEQELGSGAGRVTAVWELRPDERGRALIELTIRDWSGQASTIFAPEELEPPERARRRFNRLWGDLLQEALRKQIQVLETIEAE